MFSAILSPVHKLLTVGRSERQREGGTRGKREAKETRYTILSLPAYMVSCHISFLESFDLPEASLSPSISFGSTLFHNF